MKRRDFLRAGALSGAAALLPEQIQAEQKESSRAIVSDDFELEEKTITELARDMATDKRSSESITNAYLQRIDELDKRGPSLHAVIETNPDALSIARGLDQERRSKGPRGPLHGIPVLIKDNIDTSDRMTTTAGSYALEGSIPSRDSAVAKKLREAGAVILG